jgi:hypothetical protein
VLGRGARSELPVGLVEWLERADAAGVAEIRTKLVSVLPRVRTDVENDIYRDEGNQVSASGAGAPLGVKGCDVVSGAPRQPSKLLLDTCPGLSDHVADPMKGLGGLCARDSLALRRKPIRPLGHWVCAYEVGLKLTLRHYYDFGADRDVVGDDLVSPKAWDGFRTQTGVR